MYIKEDNQTITRLGEQTYIYGIIYQEHMIQKCVSKLEYWLSELNFPDYQQQIKFLRNLQELRSTGTGHRKGKGYEKAAGVFGLNTDNYVDVFDRILLQANAFILFLAKNFLKDWTVTLS